MTVDISKAKSLQAAVRLVAESAGMEWEAGWSRAYKNRAPGGKVDIKLDLVRTPKTEKKRDEVNAVLVKHFPTAGGAYVGLSSVHIWFDEDPGIGAKINDKAYQTRLITLSKDVKSLMITSGKSKSQLIKDLTANIK